MAAVIAKAPRAIQGRRNALEYALGLTALTFAPIALSPAEASTISEQEVKKAFSTQLAAMVTGDVDALELMLDKTFFLTHITGYRQPKQEWLGQMRQGQFIYHRMEEISVTVEMNGARARLVADTQTDSTVSGWRRAGGWRLRLAQNYEWRDSRWVAQDCVTSLW